MKHGKEEIFKYPTEMGAYKDRSEELELDGSISEVELYSALRLMVKKETGINLPVTHNGLGFNNLIYISLLLAKMQKDRDINSSGKNASVISLLAIDEPEAHLHPNMQYRFLKYLSDEQHIKVDQIFITTHSPNITAAIAVDNLIVLQREANDCLHIAYPRRVFYVQNEEDVKSKNYIQRFLDVTKADILFADKILFVEGITEQMVIPHFANLLGKSLEEEYVSVINLGGRYFSHFLKLFDKDNENAIKKRIAFITDRDPMRKGIGKNSDREKCPAALLNMNNDKYEYEESSNPMWKNNRELFKKNAKNKYIRGFMQDEESTTFEDALIYFNPTCKKLIVESMSNKKELKNLMESFDQDIVDVIDSLEGTSKFVEEIKALKGKLKNYSDKAKKALKSQIIAHRYLMSVSKGETAQELADVIQTSEYNEIQIPQYIKEAINWILKN